MSSLQEPGRYFLNALTLVPQDHAVTTLPDMAGTRMTSPAIGRFAEATFTLPLEPLVSMEATYFEGADAEDDDSQPQPLSADGRLPGDVWTASVMAVRQDDAARIISDTLALTV